MMRIKLYVGSQELEKYLNKKVQHNYILETIIPFGLFQPLRLDVLKFKKKKDLQRIYIVDSNDLVLIKRKYQNLGWQYFENNYANDEFNNDAIFYYDSIDEKELMKMNIKESCHQNDVSASLVKGLFFGTVFLIFSVICPNLMIHVNNNGLDFILGNLYIITALTLIVMAVIGKLRNKKRKE